MLRRFLHRPQGVWLRRVLFQIHLWAGVILGLYFLAISFSGSVLVFERELLNDAPVLTRTPANAARSSYGELIEAAWKGDPQYQLDSIDMRSRERRVVTMAFKSGARSWVVYADSVTGKVLKQVDLENRHRSILLLERFHNELLGGRKGAVANGVGAVLLTLMCVTGIVLWWPGTRVWKRALIVNWRARWRRVNFDLHSSVGFWTLLFVLMWGLSGVYFILPELAQKYLHVFAYDAGAKQSSWKPGDRLLPVADYLAQAGKVFPGEQLAYLYMDSSRPGRQVSVFLSRDPGVPLTLQEEIVRLDPATAEVLLTESSHRWSPVEKMLMASYSVHFGDFGGTTSKIIWAVLGLTLSLLTVTGYLMWWNRLLRRKWHEYRGT